MPIEGSGIKAPKLPAYTKKTYSGFGKGGQHIMPKQDWSFPEYNLWADLANNGMKVIESWMGLESFKNELAYKKVKTKWEKQRAEWLEVVAVYSKGKDFWDDFRVNQYIPPGRTEVIGGFDTAIPEADYVPRPNFAPEEETTPPVYDTTDIPLDIDLEPDSETAVTEPAAEPAKDSRMTGNEPKGYTPPDDPPAFYWQTKAAVDAMPGSKDYSLAEYEQWIEYLMKEMTKRLGDKANDQ